MTDTPDLDAIRARAEAATPDPWIVNYEEEDNYSVTPNGRWESGVAFAAKAPDAEFIAHAREDVPALLVEVERLRRRRDELLYRALTNEGRLAAVRKLADGIEDRDDVGPAEWLPDPSGHPDDWIVINAAPVPEIRAALDG